MGDSEDEIARLQRIRDKQLADRDPSGTRGRYQRQYSRQRSARKPMTLKNIIGTFSHKLRGLFVGVVLGFLTWIGLSVYVDAAWVDLAGLGAVLLFAAAGVLVGASFDWRDNLRNF